MINLFTISLIDGISSAMSFSYCWIFITHVGKAETWDFKLGSGSFVQFDVILGCGQKNPTENFLKLEYSDDLGLTWKAVIPECPPGLSHNNL